jgi:hypothetical protein
MAESTPRTWTLRGKSLERVTAERIEPRDQLADEERVEVIELKPVLDMLSDLKEEVGRDWYYLSTPLADRYEALLAACGRSVAS